MSVFQNRQLGMIGHLISFQLSAIIIRNGGYLSQARLLRRNITPLLNHRLLDLPGADSGPGANLFGDINTFLSWGQFGDQFGDMLAGSLRLQATFFLGSILDDSLGFIITFLVSFSEATTSRGTQLPRLLSASSNGSVLLDSLLGNIADLSGPLRALGGGGVSRGIRLTLLFNLSPALNHIICDIMNLLFSPAL